MMQDTPRAFVGRATFVIAERLRNACVRRVAEEVLRIPGVTRASVDVGSGTVSVSVDRPVDRAEIAAAVERAGHRLVVT